MVTDPSEAMRMRSVELVPKAKVPVEGAIRVTPLAVLIVQSASTPLENWAKGPSEACTWKGKLGAIPIPNQPLASSNIDCMPLPPLDVA